MIGAPHSSVLYSGARRFFDDNGALFQTWGRAEYFGDDAGLAALYDVALLAGMYVMFAGFMHGAAMVRPAGVTAKEFATRAADWLSGSRLRFASIRA
jgi:NADPH-dependent reductive aminase-like, C-terminal domain